MQCKGNKQNPSPKDTAIAIGGAIGGVATGILLFNGATSAVAGIVKGIGGSIGGMHYIKTSSF